MTLLLAPVIARLERRGTPSWLALTVAMLLYLVTIALVVVLLVVGVAGFTAQLPDDQQKLSDSLTGLLGGRDAADVGASALTGVLTALADALTESIVLIGLSVFVVAYLLLEARRGADRLRWAFPSHPAVVTRAQTVAGQLRAYLVARLILGGLAAVLDTILLLVLGIPSPFLWGVLSFLMSFVPNVGFFIALIPPTILALGVGGVPLALIVALGYVVINLTMDYVIQPRFVGSAVNLSAVVVTLSVFFWAVVLGPQGAMLAVPLTVIAANLADGYDGSRPLAPVLAEIVPHQELEALASPTPRDAAAAEPAAR